MSGFLRGLNTFFAMIGWATVIVIAGGLTLKLQDPTPFLIICGIVGGCFIALACDVISRIWAKPLEKNVEKRAVKIAARTIENAGFKDPDFDNQGEGFEDKPKPLPDVDLGDVKRRRPKAAPARWASKGASA